MLPSPTMRVQSNVHRWHGILFDYVWLDQTSKNSFCGSIQMFRWFISSIEDGINPWSFAAHSHVFQQLWVAQKGANFTCCPSFCVGFFTQFFHRAFVFHCCGLSCFFVVEDKFLHKASFDFLVDSPKFQAQLSLSNVVAQFAMLHIWVCVVPGGN